MSVQSAILVCALIVLAARNQPTFRASTRLVEVSVVVHDRNGRPVADLTKADFELLEDGQPQSIEIFSIQDERSTAPARGSLRPPARETVLTGDVRQADVSNWRDGQGHERHRDPDRSHQLARRRSGVRPQAGEAGSAAPRFVSNQVHSC